MTDNIEQRLIEVETKMAYQEHSLNELSDLVYQQQQSIDKLSASLNVMLQKLQNPSAEISDEQHEKPPHY